MRKILPLLILFFHLAVSAQTVPVYVPVSGLLAWYPFTGNANDSSGNGNNGTVNGAVLTFDRYGNPGAAYYFNGASSYISTSLLPPTGTNARTVSCWFKYNALPTYCGTGACIVGYGANNSGCGQAGENFSLELSYPAGAPTRATMDGVCTATYAADSIDTNWHCFVATYDTSFGSTFGSVKTYVDGVLKTLTIYDATTTLNTANLSQLLIGEGHYACQRSFSGKIDDIGVWNRALSPCEVYGLFQGATTTGSAISGDSILTVGATSSLSCVILGGIWSASNGNAIVSGSGLVTGLFAGMDTISYSLCDSVVLTRVVTINPFPCAGYISSSATGICAGAAVTLNDTVAGGVWFASNSNAMVTGGVVTALSAGTDTISYAVNNACGIDTAAIIITIANPATYFNISTIAGSGSFSYAGDGGSAVFAHINMPVGTAFDAAGNLYIADQANFRVRKVNTAGVISTVAGNGTAGYSGDGGAATAASLNNIMGIAVDPTGSIYISAGNAGSSYAVRKIDTTGIITTIAGNGSTGYSGDGGPATAAALNEPAGLAFDKMGNLYIADMYNSVVRLVDTTGTIYTIAGNGTPGYSGDLAAATAAALYFPQGIAIDTFGNSYIADDGNYTVRKISTAGIITTLAGTGTDGFSGDGGPATAAMLSPTGLAADQYGNVFIADIENQVIRKVNGLGVITTIAGIPGVSGISGDGGPATAGLLNYPVSVTFDASGNLFIADQWNSRIRKITPGAPPITGPSSLCIGSSITLNDTVSGLASWSSSGTGAMVNASTGTVTGVTAGSDIISYSVFNACGWMHAAKSITVNALPNAGAINTGYGGILVNKNVCLSVGSATMSESVSGGVWSLSPLTTCATISSGGVLTMLASGVANIIYTVSDTTCTNTATASLFIDSLPSLGAISGSGNICLGDTAMLTTPISSEGYAFLSELPESGTIFATAWSSSNASVATVSTAGIVSSVDTGTTTITFSATNHCGTAAASRVVTVSTSPASSGMITGYAFVHAGAVITLGETVSGGTWTATNGHATISPSGIPSGVSPGKDTIHYTIANYCGMAVATKIISVGACVTSSTVIGDSATCTGLSITLSDTTAGGAWSVSNPAATISAAGVLTGMSTGIDTVTFTYTNACASGTAMSVVTVSALPVLSVISGASYLCLGWTEMLGDSTAGGIWTVRNAVASVSDSGLLTSLVPGIDTVSYTVTNLCGSFSATKIVTVYATSISPISGPAYVCVGSTITVSDSTTGGSWSASSGDVDINSSGVVSGLANGVVVITYSEVNPCLTSIATKVISVDLTSVNAIGGTNVLCAGSSITLTDATPYGVWSSINTHASVPGSVGIVTGLTAGIDTIAYTISNSCGAYSALKTITVRQASVAAIEGPDSVCISGTITMTDSVAGGVWSKTNSNVNISTSGVVSGIYAGIDTIKYTFSDVCGSFSSSKTIVVGPFVGTISGTGGVCAGSSITLTETIAGGSWSASNANATILSDGVVEGISAGADTILYSLYGACGLAAATKIVTVYNFPAAGIIISPDSICNATSDTLLATSSGGTWRIKNNHLTLSGDVITAAHPGLDTIYYKIVNACGVDSTSTTVYVKALVATAGAITGPSSVCEGSTQTFVDTTLGGTWSVTNTILATIYPDGFLHAFSDTGSETVKYTVSNSCGSLSTTFPVTIQNYYVLAPLAGVDSLCDGSSFLFTDSVTGGIWGRSNGDVSVISGLVIANSPGFDTVMYSFTNSCGTDTVFKVVKVLPSFVDGAIMGTTSLCVGTIATYTDTIAGGVWGQIGSHLTINDSTGIALAVSYGIDTVTYTVTSSCYTAVSHLIVDVTTTPDPGTLSGQTYVCRLDSVIWTASVAGGVLSAVNSDVTVTPIIGEEYKIRGVTPGIDTILYCFSNACGFYCDTATIRVYTMLQCDSVLSVPSSVLAPATFEVFPNPSDGDCYISMPTQSEAEIVITDMEGRVVLSTHKENGSFSYRIVGSDKLLPGTYLIRAKQDGEVYRAKLTILK